MTHKPKRFFTKEDFFKNLRTSLGNQQPTLRDRITSVFTKRIPRRK